MIPRELFVSEAIANGAFATPGGELALDDAIRSLLDFSLVTSDESYLNMHRLVQHVIRNRLSAQREHWLAIGEQLVAEKFPTNGRDPRLWPMCQRLLPHALAVTKWAGDLGTENAKTADLLHSAAVYVHARAELKVASNLFERSLEVKEHVYGPANPEVARTLVGLGNVLSERPGHMTAARQRLECALEINETAYGAEDPVVASTLRDLAIVFRRQDNDEDARQLLERAFGDQRKRVWRRARCSRQRAERPCRCPSAPEKVRGGTPAA